MLAILSPWPPSVAEGSGTTVSQNRLLEALALAALQAEVLYTSRFGTTPEGLAARLHRNQELGAALDAYESVIGIDGEGWLWAAGARRTPYLAFCEAVLAEVLPFEVAAAAELLRTQAGWEAAAARSADVVVARSAFAARRVAEAYGIAPERIAVLPIPFDVDAWRAGLPPAAREPLVLAAGHTYPRKNYGTLLDAWPLVLAAHPEARLAIAGDGPESPRLARRAAGLPSVSLLGHIPFQDLLALHARASVFCHPSLQENFGIAVVEGLASGASVVAHHHPAILENLAGVPGAWPVDAADPKSLADALIAALDAPAPWSPERLNALRRKLDPRTVGEQVRALLAYVGSSASEASASPSSAP